MRVMRFPVALVAVVALIALSINLGLAQTSRSATAHLTPIVVKGSWPTYHRDNGRTGNDPTLPLVSKVTAGWTSAVLDGEIYASPVV